MSDKIYEEMIQSRGREYRSDQIKPWSHYREPVDNSPGRLAGNSRVWGDVSPEVQSRVIDALVESSRQAGLSPREAAYVLAIAKQESGFNPDAAAGTTSASGIGQFIDRTGRHYGLGNHNRFDVNAQADALVAHFIDNRNLAVARGKGEEYIYKYHHDGPTRDYGGLGLSRTRIMPLLDGYEKFVTQTLGYKQEQGVSYQSPSPVSSVAATNAATEGQQVRDLQEQLAKLGYVGKNGQPLALDGKFGPQTEHAVREFQTMHGLKVDGIVGSQTMSALEQARQQPLVTEATHPNHALYQTIAQRLPAGTDPKVAANITLQAMENGIDTPNKVGVVHVSGSNVHVLGAGNDPGLRSRTDLNAPTPDLQEMSDHMARETAQQQQQQQQQRQQQHAHGFAP